MDRWNRMDKGKESIAQFVRSFRDFLTGPHKYFSHANRLERKQASDAELHRDFTGLSLA